MSEVPEARRNAAATCWVDVVVLLGILLFLGLQFPFDLLFAPTVASGGDTPSHYETVLYLKHVLLPHGRLFGWSPSHYAGFPLLEFYFPLPFLLMVACSIVVPTTVAFKLGTVVGIFLLPLCAYGCLRLMRLPFPAPILAAVGTLPFLFSEGSTMWGGNIPSVLSGEFAYSLGFALVVLWMGSLYDGLLTNTKLAANTILLALIGLSHGYSLLFAGAVSVFFLLPPRTFLTRLVYLLTVGLGAILLLSVWFVPLIAHLPWTTAYPLTWRFSSWREFLPMILVPVVCLAVGEIVRCLYRWKVKGEGLTGPTSYLVTAGGCGVILYVIAPIVGVVDVRFIPFMQIALVLLAAIGLARATRHLKGRALIPLVVLAITCWWVGYHQRTIPDWINWNYSGFERSPLWPVHARINELLHGSAGDPRVIYEHSSKHEALGSVRVWESLPVFSGRSTLEHAYFQASPSAPFVFYLQSEISKEVSCPFPEYGCTVMDVDRAAKHLELFNIRELIIISDEMKSRLKDHPRYQLTASVPPYEIYQLRGSHHYVVPLRYEPVVWTGGRWKEASYIWFRHRELQDVHLVFPTVPPSRFHGPFRSMTADLTAMPMIPIPSSGSVQWERVSNDEVVFETSALHQPHLIKVSYHPDWRVEGAEAIYLVSPAFMLVYPNQPHVRLYYGRSVWEQVGIGLTMLGLCWLVWMLCGRRPSLWPARFEGHEMKWLWVLAMSAMSGMLITGMAVAAYRRANQPPALLAKVVRYHAQKRWDDAEDLCRRIVAQMPQSAQAEHARYYLGIINYLQQRWERAITEFQLLIRNFPDAQLAAEAHYHIALCYEQLGQQDRLKEMVSELFQKFPKTSWAGYARERWPNL